MFTIRRAQVEALALDAARRAKSEWIASLRAQGLAAHEDPQTGKVHIQDMAGGRAVVESQQNGISVTTGENRTYRFEYTPDKQVRALTDPAGLRVLFDYDERKRLAFVQRGSFGKFGFSYDSADNLTAIQYPDSSVSRMNHDDSGRMTEIIDRNGHLRQFEYSPFGLPGRVIGPKGETTSYEFDEQGELSAVVFPKGDRQTYEDDDRNGTVVLRHNDRRIVSLSADPETDTREYRYPDGTMARFEYGGDRLTAASSGECTVKLSYDEHGHLKTEDTDGRVVRYERNVLGSILALVTPEGERIVFERDNEHRLRKVVEKSGKSYEIGYELSGALASILYPNGVVVTRKSNALGALEALAVKSPKHPTPVCEVGWKYDACDRMEEETPSAGSSQKFHYDREGRLEKVTSGDRTMEEWTLDPNGNRVRDRGLRCAVNALDQLVRVGNDEFRYDDQGNMTEGVAPKGRVRCRYNGRGQLVEVESAQHVTRYVYDPFGRRIRKEEPGRVTRYTWAGQWLLSEIVEEDGRTRRRDYLVVPDLGVPLAQRVEGWNYYLHHGRRLEPLAMTDDSGTVVWKSRYDAFGTAHIETEAVSLALRLPGQYYDAETGLHYNVARYYNPAQGRFLQRDPLGIEGGCWNDYIYAGGDPLNRLDPTGEILPILGILAIGFVVGAVIGAGIEIYKQVNAGKGIDLGKIGKEALIGGAVGVIGTAVGIGLAPVAAAATAAVTGALGTASVVGAVAGAGVVLGGGAVVGGATAAVETCADSLLHGQIPDPAQIREAASFGAKIGAVTAGIGALWANRARRVSQVARELEEGERRAAQAARESEEAGRRAAQGVDDVKCPTGCPVDSLTGAVVEWKTDFVLPGALELTLKRGYSSGLEYSGCFGPRWASTWGQSVESKLLETTYHAGNGSWLVFDLPKDGGEEWVTHPETVKTSLRRTGAGFEVRDPNRCTLRFKTRIGNRLLLDEIEDPNGYWIRFKFNEWGALRLVEHSGGYRLAVEGIPTQLRRVSLLVENAAPIELMRYGYDERGRLTEVIDGSGLPLRYSYNDEDRMIRWQDRLVTWNQYEYDSLGRCVRTYGPNRIYDNTLQYDEKKRTTTVTDSLGHIKTYEYNARFLPVMQADARGDITRTVWDKRSNKLEEWDSAGRGFKQEFDEYGNLTLVRDALGRTTRIVYNALGLPEILTDAEGYGWKRTYDKRGNLIEALGPDGAAWRYERDRLGNVIRMVDPGGYARQFSYDACGLLVWSTDAKGNRTTFTRDALGRVTDRTDVLGHRTRFVYNRLGKLSGAVQADGTRLHWEYDAEGNLIRRIEPDGKAYSYRYGVFDLLQEVIKPSGGKLKLAYDTEARLAAVENEIGQVWRYEYNPTGQVVREKDFHGRVQQFDYDASGLCVRRVNGLGEEIFLERDAAGQLLAQKGLEESRYDYDALGRVRMARNGTVDIILERDAYGRVLEEKQNGLSVKSAYDARGLRVKRTASGQEYEWVLDPNGQVARLTLAGSELFQFVHDGAGREVERRMRGGLALRQEYDAMDRLTKQRAAMEVSPKRATAAVLERQFHYDANGDPSEINDARWGVSRFAYDADGRIAKAQRDRGLTEEFKYDVTGRITVARMASEKPVPAAAIVRLGLQTRFYGRDGRLEKIGDTRYEWDADGRLKEKRQGGLRWRYEWTPDGRLRCLQGPDGKRWNYQYDAFGRRVVKDGPSGTTKIVWDGTVIAEEHGPGGEVAEWMHEPGSFRPLLKQVGGQSYQCVTDQVGTPKELFSADGTRAWSTSLAVWGESVEAAETKTRCPIRFQGQWHDAESGLHYNFHRYYDPEIGQYLSPDPIGLTGGTRPYGYVHNPLTWVDPLGLVSPPDEHIVIRGGQGPVPEPGTVFSGSHGRTLEEAAKGVPHGTVRSTTVGAVKAGGGAVEIAPEPAYPGGPLNEQHVNITEGPGKSTFSEPVPNPVPKPPKVQSRPKC